MDSIDTTLIKLYSIITRNGCCIITFDDENKSNIGLTVQSIADLVQSQGAQRVCIRKTKQNVENLVGRFKYLKINCCVEE